MVDNCAADKTIVQVNADAFCVDSFSNWLNASPQDGAIVTFTGKVRSLDSDGLSSKTVSLYLEHYQGMTELVLHNIIIQARERWQLNRVIIVHRVGEILSNESIVFVGVSSGHRQDSFAAAEFIMDVLKNKAPFWKKEKTATGENWVAAKKSDQDTLKKWYLSP